MLEDTHVGDSRWPKAQLCSASNGEDELEDAMV
jgi:hypothetical protein